MKFCAEVSTKNYILKPNFALTCSMIRSLPVTAVMWLQVDHSLPGPTWIANYQDFALHALLLDWSHVRPGAKKDSNHTCYLAMANGELLVLNGLFRWL